ncbi:MAG: right-handed parallel beta-helix repeat-containing protein, partial [Planctomycetota bacterium]
MPRAWAVGVAILAAFSLTGLAEETIVDSTDLLRQTLAAADPGDRIYVAPGYYDQLLWVENVHGEPGKLIEVVALDPTNRPVFEAPRSAVFTFYQCSYVLVDGMIVQGAGTATQDGNNIMFTYSDHMILRNTLSRDIVHTGNSDGTKFNHSEDVLMYNCTISEWGEAGSGMDGMISNSDLFMRNTITFPSLATAASANGIMPKGAAYHHGMYKNLFIDGSSRAVCFGGSGGAAGPEIRDSVAMGNVIVGGEAAVAYCSATTCDFAYNTVVNPEKWVMRVQKEGAYETDNCGFRRNLVEYGPFLPWGSVQGTGGTVHPETFTYEANYWYKWDNPAASIPYLPGGETDPAGGVDPQLDSDYRPRYGPAKEYGAHAPAMEAEFQQYTHWFQWAWDRAMEFEPDADAGGSYQVGPGET